MKKIFVNLNTKEKIIKHENDNFYQMYNTKSQLVIPERFVETSKDWVKIGDVLAIGTRIKIIKAIAGCFGAEGLVGTITTAISTAGLLNNFEHPIYYTFNIKIDRDSVWRVACEDYEILNDKGYEILEFSDGFNKYFKQENGKFTINTAYDYEEKDLLNLKNKITRIKRLSDGEVFSIGDYIDFNSIGNAKLEEIEYEISPVYKGTGKLTFINDHEILGKWWDLETLKKIKPLFTTEDGVDIFEGDSFVHTNGWLTPKTVRATLKHKDYSLSMDKIFSTADLALEYVTMNRFYLSIKDVLNAVDYAVDYGYEVHLLIDKLLKQLKNE